MNKSLVGIFFLLSLELLLALVLTFLFTVTHIRCKQVLESIWSNNTATADQYCYGRPVLETGKAGYLRSKRNQFGYFRNLSMGQSNLCRIPTLARNQFTYLGIPGMGTIQLVQNAKSGNTDVVIKPVSPNHKSSPNYHFSPICNTSPDRLCPIQGSSDPGPKPWLGITYFPEFNACLRQSPTLSWSETLGLRGLFFIFENILQFSNTLSVISAQETSGNIRRLSRQAPNHL